MTICPACTAAWAFLSTLPVRGATRRSGGTDAGGFPFLSTLPVRGATPCTSWAGAEGLISIHAPREGSDGGHLFPGNCLILFLSTLPVRGATSCGPFIRAETTFLSTLPVRGATG